MPESSEKRGPRRAAVVLAAGKGTRMRSELPKVLHPAAGRPMLAWVLDAARASGADELLAVVGHGADEVRQRFEGTGVTWVLQEEQLGTGHALAQTESHLGGEAIVWVLSGDVPLVTPSTLERLAQAAAKGWGAMAVAEVEEPGSLGRVIGEGGRLERIVEAADASPEELAITRINAGIYALPAPAVFDDLRGLGQDNAKGEFYLTDALGAAAARGEEIALVELEDPGEALGVNTRRDLARAHRALIDRHLEALMDAGVSILEPARTTVEPTVRVGADTVIHPGVSLLGDTEVGSGCELHTGVWIRSSRLGDGVVVEPYSTLDGARVADDCAIGPFARLRPASVLQKNVRVGNFVELKKAELGEGAKASHLTYLGDASVGRGANVGAGVVTCNYDGVAKHRTEIGEGAFIGSDTMLVAPVRVGDGATTGAGSVINQEVPDGALGVARARQRNVLDWAERQRARREKKKD